MPLSPVLCICKLQFVQRFLNIIHSTPELQGTKAETPKIPYKMAQVKAGETGILQMLGTAVTGK